MHIETEIAINDCLNISIRSAFDSFRILVFRSTTLFIYPVEKLFDTNSMCDIAVWMGEAVHINYFTIFAIIGSDKTIVTRHRKSIRVFIEWCNAGGAKIRCTAAALKAVLAKTT